MRRTSPVKRRLISRMLSGGMTYRDTARKSRTSRGTVQRVAEERAAGEVIVEEQARSEYVLPQVHVEKYKCEGCGYDVVVKPCLICQARVIRKRIQRGCCDGSTHHSHEGS